jgi:hypothetical protein
VRAQRWAGRRGERSRRFEVGGWDVAAVLVEAAVVRARVILTATHPHPHRRIRLEPDDWQLVQGRGSTTPQIGTPTAEGSPRQHGRPPWPRRPPFRRCHWYLPPTSRPPPVAPMRQFTDCLTTIGSGQPGRRAAPTVRTSMCAATRGALARAARVVIACLPPAAGAATKTETM